MATEQDLMEKIVSLAKRRGFIFPSSEIYGGINGFWDYGPLGVELKRNIKDAWWHDVVRSRDDIVGLDCSIIMNPKVWEASGHVVNFNDPLVDCKQCKARFRADQFYECQLCAVKEIPASFSALERSEVEIASPARESFLVESGSSVQTIQEVARRALGRKRAKVVEVPDRNGTASEPWLFLSDGAEKFFLAPYNTQADPAHPYHKCPHCAGELTLPRKFNMMFKSHAGAMEDSASEVYLRPETAQGIFVNYSNVLDTSRLKIPFGIAQIGKAFRNEINPRNYTFRSREFEQMEIEFFCHPSEADKWYAYWRDARFKWYVAHGLKSDKLRLRDHAPDELAHYARACADVEYAFPFGVAELEGIANRTDFDLKAHADASHRDMTYFDDQTKERYVPYVIEPSGGVDRAALAFLCEAFDEDEAPDEKGNPQRRTVLRFHPRLAPIKVAVFPLVRKDGMPEKAHAIWEACREHLAAFYDEKGAVGRRYRRQDEAGTPFCVTVDGQTAQDGTVTVRDRDSMQQVRVPAEGVLAYVRERLHL